jgi:membrane-associated phosphatidylinositol transfer protein
LSQHNFPHGLVSFADGLSTDPLGHKAAYLNNLIQNHGLDIHACYGSSKDISVYTSIGLKPKQIYIVGKVSLIFRKFSIKQIIFFIDFV